MNPLIPMIRQQTILLLLFCCCCYCNHWAKGPFVAMFSSPFDFLMRLATDRKWVKQRQIAFIAIVGRLSISCSSPLASALPDQRQKANFISLQTNKQKHYFFPLFFLSWIWIPLMSELKHNSNTQERQREYEISNKQTKLNSLDLSEVFCARKRR